MCLLINVTGGLYSAGTADWDRCILIHDLKSSKCVQLLKNAKDGNKLTTIYLNMSINNNEKCMVILIVKETQVCDVGVTLAKNVSVVFHSSSPSFSSQADFEGRPTLPTGSRYAPL